MGACREWSGTVTLSAKWIDVIKHSMKVVPNIKGSDSLSNTPNVTRLKSSPERGWRVMVPEADNLVLNVLRMSCILRLRIVFCQLQSRTSTLIRLEAKLALMTRTAGFIRNVLTPIDTETQ